MHGMWYVQIKQYLKKKKNTLVMDFEIRWYRIESISKTKGKERKGKEIRGTIYQQ